MLHVKWGLAIGCLAGLLIAFGSFTQFVVVAFFSIIGAAVGWLLQDRVDLGQVFSKRRR